MGPALVLTGLFKARLKQMKKLFQDPIEEDYSGKLYIGEDGLQIVIHVP
jgi:hypothetical protein